MLKLSGIISTIYSGCFSKFSMPVAVEEKTDSEQAIPLYSLVSWNVQVKRMVRVCFISNFTQLK